MICLVASFMCMTAFAGAETANFASAKMVGTQLRPEDNGIRFVLEMNENDYLEYLKSKEEGATKKYTAGILVYPTALLNGAELTFDMPTVENIVFADDYVAKKVTTDDGAFYRFHGVLTGIPKQAISVSARGYITDGTTTGEYLTNTISNTISRISAVYYGEMEDENQYKAKMAENVVSAFNQVTGSEITSLDEINTTMELNSVNSLLVGHKDVEGYNDDLQIAQNLDKVFEYSLASSDAETISINQETNELTAHKYGNSVVTLSAMGKQIGELKVNAMDSEIVKLGVSGVASSGDTTAKRTVSIDNAGKTYSSGSSWLENNVRESSATTLDGKNRGYYNTTDSKFSTETINGVEQKIVTASANGGMNALNNYFAFNSLYTKEQIAMILSAGYNTINIPVKVNVSEENITALNRNFATIFTPTQRITGQNVSMGYKHMDTGFLRQTRIYFNEWTTIRFSLKTLYDNFDQMAFYRGSADGTNFPAQTSYETRMWAWLGTFDLNETNKSVSFADIYLTKVTESYDSIDLKCETVAEGLLASIAASNSEYNVYPSDTLTKAITGTARTTVTAKKDGKDYSVTGDFLYFANSSNYGYEHHYDPAKNSNYLRGACFANLGLTVQKLQQLKADGYTALSFDFCFLLEYDARTEEQGYGNDFKYNIYGLDMNAYKMASISINTWYTMNLSIDDLITHCENMAPGKASAKPLLWITALDSTNYKYVHTTTFVSGFNFVK